MLLLINNFTPRFRIMKNFFKRIVEFINPKENFNLGPAIEDFKTLLKANYKEAQYRISLVPVRLKNALTKFQVHFLGFNDFESDCCIACGCNLVLLAVTPSGYIYRQYLPLVWGYVDVLCNGSDL